MPVALGILGAAIVFVVYMAVAYGFGWMDPNE